MQEPLNTRKQATSAARRVGNEASDLLRKASTTPATRETCNEWTQDLARVRSTVTRLENRGSLLRPRDAKRYAVAQRTLMSVSLVIESACMRADRARASWDALPQRARAAAAAVGTGMSRTFGYARDWRPDASDDWFED